MERKALKDCTKLGLQMASNGLQLPSISLVLKKALRFPLS